MNAPSVGSTGRALTPLNPSGRVEVDGMIYRAETAMPGAEPRPPVPAGREIVVSGWRADNEHGVVLLVSDPLAPPADAPPAEPAPPPPPPTTEERIAAVELELREVRRTRDLPPEPWPGGDVPPGDFGWFVLTVGQVVSALVCLATPVGALLGVGRLSSAAAKTGDSAPGGSVFIVLEAAIIFLLSAAMCVVFTRVKRLPP